MVVTKGLYLVPISSGVSKLRGGGGGVSGFRRIVIKKQFFLFDASPYPLFLFAEHFFQQQVAPLKSVNESMIPREEFIWAKFECKDVSAERQNLSFKRLRKDFNFAWLCSRESVLLVTSQTIWMPAVLVENFTCLKTWKWEIFKLLFHLYQVSCSPDVVFKPSPFTSSHVLTSQR